jgi:hypothetical protein
MEIIDFQKFTGAIAANDLENHFSHYIPKVRQ